LRNARFGARVVLNEVKKSAKAMAEMGDGRQVLFSFLSDAYQSFDSQVGLTRRAIALLHDWGIPVAILTKGGLRATRDFDLLTARDSFACTLTTLDDDTSRWWEPGAALPTERLAALRIAHDRGIPTWVSLEPVLNPADSLACLEASADFVDEYKIGVLNYCAEAKGIDWHKFGHDAVALCDRLGKAYYLKHDLRKLM
jgi:DNA repair photolyase